jgi:PadR family transcriptional regulator PadR
MSAGLAEDVTLCKTFTMPEPVRMTIAVAAVLRIFLDDITRPRYGYELMRATGYPSGKLYPVLARLERAGWLTKELEDIDPATEGRPARRLYRISAEAVQAARSELATLSAQLQPPARQPHRLRPQGDLA